MNRLAQRTSQRGWICACIQKEREHAALILRQRQIEKRRRRFSDECVSSGLRHAYNFDPRIVFVSDAYSLSNGVLVGPITPGAFLVHDRDERRTLLIGDREC